MFCSGVVDSQDGFQYLAVARNIYYKGKPTAPPYELYTRKNIHMPVLTGKDGNSYGFTGLGFSIAMVPVVFLTDIVYKIYDVAPPVHFPLENDWLILLAASFTNAFFGALLGVIFFLYLIEFKLSKSQSLLLSFLFIFSTNLFVYTKHINAHMMFVTFLTLSFYLLKKYSSSKNKIFLFFSGISFGIMAITYNSTFLLVTPALILYYFILSKPKRNRFFLKKIVSDFAVFLIGFLPGFITYLWFEDLRSAVVNQSSPIFLTDYAQNRLLKVPIPILYEGLYGQLFSPGRSIFIYSPVLLILIFFWHKIKFFLKPELIAFLVLSAIYIIFYSAQYSIGAVDQGTVGLWHGESSWGPRYLLPLLPLGLLIVGYIYTKLSKLQRLFIFFPLVTLGLYVQILGVLIPYQTKYYNLMDFNVNNQEYRPFVYSNLLPRYSPILNMSKNLVKLAQNFPKTLDKGIYNVRFYDGIDFPFNVGPERWRVIEGKGLILFDDNQKNPVKQLSFGLINHPIYEGSESAKFQSILNDTPLLDEPLVLDVTQRELIKVPIKSELVKPKDNRLVLEVDFGDPQIIPLGKQIFGLQSMSINNQAVNKESIGVPYVSPLGPKLAGITYFNWGGLNQDPWRLWNLHTQTFERTPDFWWVRNLFYWDIPKAWILVPFVLNLIALIFTGMKLKKHFKNF